MPKRVKFNHGYYYVVTPQELQENHMKGKKVVIDALCQKRRSGQSLWTIYRAQHSCKGNRNRRSPFHHGGM